MKKLLHNINFYRLVSFIIIISITLCSCSEYNFESYGNYYSRNNDLSAHFLDVGQGDSIFIELPNAQTMLIDASTKGMGKSIVNYVNSLGYDKIDYLVATHPHADHIGSMAYIVKNMDIGDIYMPKVSASTNTYKILLETIYDKGLKVKSAKSGISIIDTEDFDVDILGPVTIDESNLNNCSIVLKITFENKKFLFTGDAENDELSSIKTDISSDVLKVGHHGSRTSTTKDFVERVNPDIVVISSGKNNEYGHPHKSTLKYLNNIGAEIYRTDKDKTVTVTSDGENITVEAGGISMIKDD